MKIAKTKKFSPERLAQFRDFSESFISELSQSKEDRKLYLQVAIEDYEQDKDLPALLLALRNIAIACGGIQELAGKTKLHRQTLYKALSPKGNPSFALVDLIVNSLGMQLSVKSR